jgi:hypothetical protein
MCRFLESIKLKDGVFCPLNMVFMIFNVMTLLQTI